MSRLKQRKIMEVCFKHTHKMNAQSIIKYPLSSEKSIRLMEAENKLGFVVHEKATKAQVRSAIEELFKAKVRKVTTVRTIKGEKKAYVTFAPDTPAIDVATNLGLM